ncbi:MAG TPA: glycosyl hydrolase family 28-related protein, partial [Terracidiphilus sp.]|nr:glycosyl hydrolase family 28-related protein [Terracidiphilus sp.]
GGSSSSLYAGFTAANAIQFPGLAASSGHNCVEIDSSGYLSNTGSPCGAGGSGSGTVNAGATGQIAYYNANGAAVSGLSAVPVSAGGTGATTASGALAALGAASLSSGSAQTFTGAVSAPSITASVNSQINVMAPPYNAKGDCSTDDSAAIQAALNDAYNNYSSTAVVYFPAPPGGCYIASLTYNGISLEGQPSGLANAVNGGNVVIRSKPGQDVLHVPDPTTSNFAWKTGWSIRNITFMVDDSVAGSFPHRWPGRWFDDASMTAGSAVLTTSNGQVTCADAGQAIQVNGAGSAGSNLVTTIASVSPCWMGGPGWQTITLAATASTSVSNAHTYISVQGLPVTATIGACGLAFDDMDGNTAGWAFTGQKGNLTDTLQNVTFKSSSGTTYGQNNSCGIYTQGVWGFYGLDARNWNFLRLAYGVVQGSAELSSYSQSSGNDFQKWDHGDFNLVAYPWISYNGTYGRLEDVELATQSGPAFLSLGNQFFDSPSRWIINVPEFEDNTTYGFIFGGGTGDTLINTQLAGSSTGTAYIDASNLTCTGCESGNSGSALQIGGNGNRLFFNTDISGVAIQDQGQGNLVTTTQSNAPPGGIPLNNAITYTPTKGQHELIGRISADFIRDGNFATPYNYDDLFLWPKDFILSNAGGTVPYSSLISADTGSPTGQYLTMNPGTTYTGWFQFIRPLTNVSGSLVVGSSLPANRVTAYFTAACPAGTSSFQLAIIMENPGFHNIDSQTFSCTTAYANYSMTFDASSWSGYDVGLEAAGASFNLAWLALRPYQADYNGYQPAHSGANADITSLTGLTTPLSTAQGGTGSGALTGYRYANGSGADTASATIPVSALSSGVTGSGAVVLAGGPTFTGNTTTFANSAAAEQDVVIRPGSTADQVGAYAFANYSGTTQWKLRKDASNYLRLTDTVNSLDREVLYPNGQSILNAGSGANAVVLNGTTNSGTGGLLVQNGGSSPSTVFTVTGSGNTTATGFVSGRSMMGTGTMTLAAGAAAGTSPSIACASGHVCDGVSGAVALTTGTSPATGTLATLTFPNTHSNAANCVLSVASGTAQLTSVTWSESTTAITLTANTALTAGTAYQVRYWCGGN